MNVRWALAIAGLVAVGVSLPAALPAAQAGKAVDPIVGYWNFSGGVIRVSGGPTSFSGVVVKETRFSSCTHPVGEPIWKMKKQGSSYVGTHAWFDSDTCVPGSAGLGPSTWTIAESEGQLVLHQCTTSPHDPGDTRCDDLTRAKAVKPKPPPPKPKPKPPPATWEKLVLGYEIPRRYGLDENKDGLVDYFKHSFEIDPDDWQAVITVKRQGGASCDPEASYSWRIGGFKNAFERVGTCTFAFRHFPRLGDFRVNVITSHGDQKGVGEVWVTIDDYLIVGLGDSNGSGEGNPDIPGVALPKWEDFRCHRSAQSYQARTASAIEKSSDQASVTFVHLACSGASLPAGLLGHYRGINDPGGVALPAQVDQLDRLLGRRKPDAVILSVGVNDIGFGPLVAFCIEQNGCFARKGFDPSQPNKDLDDVVAQRIAALPGWYAKAAARFKALGIKPGDVYVTEYFDSTRDSGGKTCNPLVRVYGHGTFTETEADWAYDNVLIPLNHAVAAAAREHGWHLVSGAQQLFRRHGYCSDDSWIVPLTSSLFKQGLFWKGLGAAKAGTLHANAEGHQIQARLVSASLKRNGITGKPRTAY